MVDHATQLSDAVLVGAELLLALTVARVALSVALSLAARALRHRPSGHRIGRLALTCAPRVGRGLVVVAIGSGLAVAAPATAAPPAPGTTTTPTVPALDRGASVTATADRPPSPRAAPHRGPDGGPATGRRTATRPRAAARGAAHVVRPGDSLWSIAAAEAGPAASDGEIAASWPRWYAANRSSIGPDPAVLRPGQHLHRPAADGPPRRAHRTNPLPDQELR